MTRPTPSIVAAQYVAGFVFGVLLGLMAIDMGRQSPPSTPPTPSSYPGP